MALPRERAELSGEARSHAREKAARIFRLGVGAGGRRYLERATEARREQVTPSALLGLVLDETAGLHHVAHDAQCLVRPARDPDHLHVGIENVLAVAAIGVA